jgi:hypothetical protein
MIIRKTSKFIDKEIFTFDEDEGSKRELHNRENATI